jgi:hypothetical protein
MVPMSLWLRAADVIKNGNNGGQNCSDFCHSSTPGPSMPYCAAALDTSVGQYISCDAVRGINNSAEVTCLCDQSPGAWVHRRVADQESCNQLNQQVGERVAQTAQICCCNAFLLINMSTVDLLPLGRVTNEACHSLQNPLTTPNTYADIHPPLNFRFLTAMLLHFAASLNVISQW